MLEQRNIYICYCASMRWILYSSPRADSSSTRTVPSMTTVVDRGALKSKGSTHSRHAEEHQSEMAAIVS